MEKSDKPFSERNKYKKSQVFQIESINKDLRSRLWNVIYKGIVKSHVSPNYEQMLTKKGPAILSGEYLDFHDKIIDQFFKRPVSEINMFNLVSILGEGFLDEKIIEWWKVYDFLEFIITCMKNSKKDKYNTSFIVDFINKCNKVLEEENSAWRVKKDTGTVVPIANETELQSIEEASTSDTFGIHIKKAVRFLSLKQNPDYENSIKESILAVESILKQIGSPKKTLGQNIKNLQDIHPALREGFSKLYGFTSDKNGIRHASFKGYLTCDFETAKYMLVTCSAFCNLLNSKFSSTLKK